MTRPPNPPVDLGKHPTDDDLMTSGVEQPARRSLRLSRETKMLLVALTTVSLIGGWYIYNTNQTADPAQAGTDQQTPDQPAAAAKPTPISPTPTTPTPTSQEPTDQAPLAAQPGTAPTAGTPPASGAVTSPAPGSTPVTPQSAVTVAGATVTGPVQVQKIPFLNPAQDPVQTPPQGPGTTASSPAAPGGINPQDPLASVPVSNPFTPLKVVRTDAPAAAAPSTASTPAPVSLPQAALVPAASTRLSTRLSTGGVIPLPDVPVAGIGNPAPATGPGSSTGPATSTGPAPGVVITRTTPLSSGGVIPLPDVPVSGLGGTRPAVSPAPTGQPTAAQLPGAALPGTPGALPVVRPPVYQTPPRAGVTAPSSVTALNTPSSASQPAPATPLAGTVAPTGTDGVGSASPLSVSVAAPGVTPPTVVTQYGVSSIPATPLPAQASPLDTLITSRAISFNAVVLGPINTAIFKTAQGFVVVAVGQTLPDSSVVLKEVTATSAALTLGSETKTLELDKSR